MDANTFNPDILGDPFAGAFDHQPIDPAESKALAVMGISELPEMASTQWKNVLAASAELQSQLDLPQEHFNANFSGGQFDENDFAFLPINNPGVSQPITAYPAPSRAKAQAGIPTTTAPAEFNELTDFGLGTGHLAAEVNALPSEQPLADFTADELDSFFGACANFQSLAELDNLFDNLAQPALGAEFNPGTEVQMNGQAMQQPTKQAGPSTRPMKALPNQRLKPILRLDTGTAPSLASGVVPNRGAEYPAQNVKILSSPPPFPGACYSPGRGWYLRSDIHNSTSSRTMPKADSIRDATITTHNKKSYKPTKKQTFGPQNFLSKKRAREDEGQDDGRDSMPSPQVYDIPKHPLQGLRIEQMRSYISQECSCNSTVHVKRPPNSFMLYRSDLKKRMHGRDMQKLSANAGKSWSQERPEVKAHFQALAEQAKTEHARRNPNYRYHPRSQAEKEMIKFGDSSCTCGAWETNMANIPRGLKRQRLV